MVGVQLSFSSMTVPRYLDDFTKSLDWPLVEIGSMSVGVVRKSTTNSFVL